MIAQQKSEENSNFKRVFDTKKKKKKNDKKL